MCDFSKLDAFLDSLFDQGFAYTEVYVKQRHKLLYHKLSGYNDPLKKEPAIRNGLYYIFSCTKPVTVSTAFTLFEQGRFLMNDPLSLYFPEFAHVKVLYTDENGKLALRDPIRPILIRDLFSMTGGLSYNIHSPVIQEVKKKTCGRCPTVETMRAFAREPLVYDPGTAWFYSLSHDVLGALIEVLADMPLSDYMKKAIFDPLGMKETGFRMPVSPRRVKSWNYQNGNYTEATAPNPYILGTEYESGGAGLVSTPHDYSLFTDMLANEGVGESGARVLAPTSIRLMKQNCLTPEQLPSFWGTLRDAGYGYGYGVRTIINPSLGSPSPVGEFGWDGAMGSYLLVDTERGLSAFLAKSSSPSGNSRENVLFRNILYSCL